MTDAIKPCPFCGGRAALDSRKNIAHDNAEWWVHCVTTTCYVIGPKCTGPESAVIIWNERRPSPDSERVRELKAQLAEVLNVARHTHQARYAVSGERAGKLMDACNECGLDLRHEVHSTSPATEKVKHRPDNVRCTKNASDHVDIECDCQPAPEKAK